MDRIEEIENALTIVSARPAGVEVDDERRITGPGLLWDRPGAEIDVYSHDVDPARIVALWTRHARKVLDAVGWEKQSLTHRIFDGGANLAISAPMDQLYSAVFAVETAWHFCAAELAGEASGDFDSMISDLTSVMAKEANPALVALIDAANARGVDVLCDDDELSLGQGVGSQTWPVSVLPAVDDVNWDALHNIPVVLITGTNGKTTTTRLCEAIARASGKVAGLSSTEFVRVGDDILDRGDYSGPGGGRMLLRDKRLEIGCLEVARGGILRRGMPTRAAKAAVVTNVANDHLGQYGINTVPDLAQVKLSVRRGLVEGGVLVLNADDEFVREAANGDMPAICWYSLDPEHALISDSRKNGRTCAYLKADRLVYFDGVSEQDVIGVDEVPITMNGAAKYNIQNALGALCLSKAMDLPVAAIRAGLTAFKPDAKDNPGRCNEFSYNGARVFVDFAHNPHSVAAVCDALSSLPAKRRFIMVSHAGDRSDQDIRDVTNTALSFKPDVLVTVELENYLRGRQLGEIPALIEQVAREASVGEIWHAASPSAAARRILDTLEEGDLALLLVLDERAKVFDMLA